MRKRIAVAGLAVLLTATGGLAYADPFSHTSDEPTASSAVGAPIVTLPTGDKVRVSRDGALIPINTNGRPPQFHSPRLPGGDRILIPTGSLTDVAAGKIDDRLFNVDALLRNGYTDARDVPSPDRLGKSSLDDDTTATADTTKVTVKFSWKDGSAPEAISGGWAHLTEGKRDLFMENGGTATVALPAGDYAFQAAVAKGDNVITTVFDLTVTDKDQTVKVDGGKAKRVGFDVDADDAVAGVSDFSVFNNPADGRGTATGFLMSGSAKAYAIPSKKFTGHKAGLTLQSELSSPSGAAKPYTYSLFGVREKGIPAKPTLTVHDEELAVRETTYNKLGSAADMARANLADNAAYPPMTYAPGTPVKLGTTRTEYYSTAHDVAWSHQGTFPATGDDPIDDVLHHSGKVSPGSEKATWLSAPLSVGVSDPAFPYYGSGFRRFREDESTDFLGATPPVFTSGSADEIIVSYGGKGTKATLSKDGTELDSSQDAGVGAFIPTDDKGRYTASFDVTHGADWTPLGTRSTATWTFDSGPITEGASLSVSAVRFNASGVKNGYAKASKPQKVNLEYVTQPGAEDRDCAKLSFAVSYDDGKTWKNVTVDREGDKATAVLEHPGDAKFVSVKFSATDDKGQTVKHSTIRSYGLK
ncbi:hypothetical protein [Stackebrandtia nassauensis]|uniref:Peptidase S8 and S53 subtilisin kexin sedolisin n=1 Tax=Stackebrandtia nassauensis (strain DSM 44728 / CIP 108903 / NRRL B-16338 / NBRC 102104 / LLR-40K-21) TaxID=446470 RepID=D3Q9E4_STANL|nr:hypothetical protein [Stackebrandtia nassauensis]ADD42626.1 hypothetical protein Snas_2951 [Stackebrandtia nassauensis DSM 44728]